MQEQFILEGKNISFSYDSQKKVLDDVNISLREKDFLVIMGASGSGKSTLLKVLNGSLKLKSGSVFLNGDNISKLNRRERAQFLAMVPQEIDTNIPFTVKEIVSFSRLHKYSRWQKMPVKDKEIISNAMFLVDIEHKKDAIFSTLSGGEKQRVLIASALALEPKILLLDEPTSSLDIGHNMKIMHTLKKLNNQGVSIILLTHNLTNIQDCADYVIALKNGKIVAEGSSSNVLTRENISNIFDYQFTTFCETKID